MTVAERSTNAESNASGESTTMIRRMITVGAISGEIVSPLTSPYSSPMVNAARIAGIPR